MTQAGAAVPSLSNGQLLLIARRWGVYGGKSLADVGVGAGEWLGPLHARGLSVSALTDRVSDASTAPFLHRGQPAAAPPWAVHSLDVILYRGPQGALSIEANPELAIALANLLSSLSLKGRMLIPVTDAAMTERWLAVFQAFPVSARTVEAATSVWRMLTLRPLWEGRHQVRVVEVRLQGALRSRLDWHRIAREAVLSRMQPPAAA